MEIPKDVTYELLLSRLNNIVLFLDNIASRIDFRAFNWELTEDGKHYAELNKQRSECESALDSVNPGWHTSRRRMDGDLQTDCKTKSSNQ